MNKREIYKKGINDASNSYHRKFDCLSEELRDSISKQDSINEKNYRLQKQMIDNEERIDMELDRIYEILGEERMPGASGNATITPDSSQIITTYTNGMLNKYNSFSNLEALAFDTQIVDAIADFLAVAVEKDLNKRFHQSLTVLEQNGLITQEKFEQHKRSVIAAKQLTGLGVYAAFSLAPIVCTSINNYLNKSEVIDFVVGVYAYINRELSPLVKYDISHLLSQMDINVSEKKIQSIFEKYSTNSGMSHLPVFTKRNRSIFGNDGMDVLAKEILSRCDLHNPDTKNRAMEFLEDFLRIDRKSAENVLSDAGYAQDALSDITWFSAINYRYVFLDFIKDINNARQFAFYDINNDPYSRIREDRRQQMEAIVNDVSAKKSLFLTTGKRKDIIDASAKMIQYSLNPSYDISTDIKMIKREKRVLELYGL